MRSMPFFKPAFDGRGLFMSSKRGGDFEGDTTSCCKFARNHGMGGGDCTHKVVQNSISDRFRKGSCVSERVEEKLKRLTFNALLFRGVANGDGGEVGLTCDGAEGGELWGGKGDLVRTVGLGIGKGFQSSQGGIGGDGCFAAKKAESRHVGTIA